MARALLQPPPRIRVTASAPHVRDAMSVGLALQIFLAALVPPALLGVYNTGRQANLAMQALGVDAAPGWRGRLIEFLGTGYEASEPAAALVHGAVYFAPVLLTAIAVGIFWTRAFALTRGRRPGQGVVATALVITLLLPPAVPLWLAALGMSFGIVFGREIFGGFGRNVLNPAAVALSFLHVTYPAQMMADRMWVPVPGYDGANPLDLAAQGGLTELAAGGVTWFDAFLGNVPGTFGETSTLACLLGAAVLLWAGLASWRVMAGVVLGAVLAALAFGLGGDGSVSMVGLPPVWHLVLGSLAFGAVYMASDPVTSASTDTGRWIYGALVGALDILIRVAAPVHADGMVFAVLLGNVFAPSIDHAVTWVNIRRRSRRYVA